MRYKHLFQNYFFKKRLIYRLDLKKLHTKQYENISVEIINESVYHKFKLFFESRIPKEKIAKRINNPAVVGVIAIDINECQPIGYFWGYKSISPTWHDQYLIDKGNGFLFNGYVSENYRGKGMFPLLIYSCTKVLTRNMGCENVYDIVESLNFSSVRSHEKIGAQICYNNYLVKLWRRNIFSVLSLKDRKRFKIYYVFNKRKKMNLL